MIIDNAGGLVFRPPSEARSFILRVTIGCSHNTCTFCPMYKASPFRVRPLSEIDGIIDRGAAAFPFMRRVFLADGDALVLPTDSLIHIMQRCYEKFPHLTRIGAYATPGDLIRKTPEELKKLREAGLAILYMGIESGDDETLRRVQKGTTAAMTIEAGKKALAAGMKLSAMVLLGLGGQERSAEHAAETAKVVTAINPTMLSALSLIISDAAPIYDDVVNGTFKPLTARGFLQELRTIIGESHMEKPCIFRSNHPSNLVPIGGTLPKDKDAILEVLDLYIPKADDRRPLLNDMGNF